ncbi:MAG TPA: ABC transporter ATP-binding protein [Acidimicrobiia bacterium]|nr:ABC transporter ATP-binding protein [Acidimicrobiia bacterium]
MAGGHVRLQGLVKSFGETMAVDNVDLEIESGEFFSLLGPSGCGKTTTLRLVAGFERPTAGRIEIDGEDMAATAPHLRPVNTVFQSYALFPHLDVADNVAFGLRYQNASKTETTRKVGAALELVQLTGMENRRPNQLSGGQQQRVALARALVLEPRVLLLDEPLGALDAKLRKALQIELKSLQEQIGITFIYVTHDQEEALTMSDRLAVMSNGLVEQVGGPAEVYERPVSAYVADFLGISNMLPAQIETTDDGSCRIRIGDGTVMASGHGFQPGAARVAIRPERIELCQPIDSPPENRLNGRVERVVYAGALMQVLVRLDGSDTVQALVTNNGSAIGFAAGDVIGVRFPAEAVLVLPPGALS